jgi:hypothetical protein
MLSGYGVWVIACMGFEGATADPVLKVVASAMVGSVEVVMPPRKDSGWSGSGCGPV